MKNEFEVLSVEGLCTIVPPSYFEHFGQNHPQLFSMLKSEENKMKTKWPWNVMGDYFIISLKKKN